jgi:ABC-2 type transport system ATP-binding protein
MEMRVRLSREPGAQDAHRLAGVGLIPTDEPLVWVGLDVDGYAAAARLDTRLRELDLAPREIRVREPSLANLFTLVAERKLAA